jgi:hypothetical protein
MLGKLRDGAAGILLLAVLMVQGCSQPPAVKPGRPPIAALPLLPPPFSLNTPVERIAADRRGNAVLKRDMPGLLTNPSYLLFNDMSLLQIASLSCGRLTKIKLVQVQADLTQLSN